MTNSSNTANNPVAVIAVLRSAPFRPEPPAAWALARDTGLGWIFEDDMKIRLESYRYDSDLDHYTLYVAPRAECHPRDLDAMRVSKAPNDVVHRETLCDDDTLMAVRQAAHRRGKATPVS
ncbi:hypothetical protein [Nonomuraea sp. NPDC050202]|uniref:hypothetical protein n=1 Tax=Nonomuraea sp. NPDC050202 TaxID=3155035 RepID=UPI0033CB3217